MTRLCSLLCSLAVFALLATPPATASTLTVGNVSGSDCSFACFVRFQQLYDASIFSGPAVINSVSFFSASDFSWAGVNTWQISLSTTSKAFNGLSATFADNVGGDAVLFDTKKFTGALNAGDLVTFNGAFVYNPNLGNLLIDIIRIAGPPVTSAPADILGVEAGFTPPLFTRSYSFLSTTAAFARDINHGDGIGDRTQFELSEVPEPSTGLLVIAGLLVLAARSRARA